MLQTAYAHQDEGRPVYICTAATQDMAEILAQVLGFDGAAGSRLEKRDGLYTGRFDGPFCYGEGKPMPHARDRRARRARPRDVVGLLDCASDLPMLRAVGHAVVVNPDPELAQVAREEGWDVHALRDARPPAEDRRRGARRGGRGRRRGRRAADARAARR